MSDRACSRIAVVLACAAGLLLSGAWARTAQGQGSPVPAEFRSIWLTLDTAWNERDAARFAELFTADGSLEFVDRGETLESRRTIRDHFAERFPRFAPDVRHRTSVGEIRVVSPEVGIVDGGVEILRVDGEGNAEPAVLKTFSIFAVMLRTADGWRIRALRAYELAAPADQDH